MTLDTNFRLRPIGALALLFAAFAWLALPAAAQDNVTPDAIFGSGNDNGSFTINRSGGVELGIRGKLRHNESGLPENTFNSNGDGTYSFDAGVAPTQSFPTGEWSFEWSINSEWDDALGATLDDYTYELGLDADPNVGTSFVAFDPINGVEPGAGTVCWDHSMGDNTTANGGGVEVGDCRDPDGPTAAAAASDYAANIGTYNVAQNSWKPHWINPAFDPTVPGYYEIYLKAFDGAALVAETSITIIVGNPNDVTPDAIFGSGNANGSFTTNRYSSVEVGLRGKLRHNGSGLPENTFNSNGDGTYSFNAGVAPTQSFPTAEWSFEWSINSDFNDMTEAVLDDFDYMLMIDTDPGPGTSYLTFDPIHDVEPGAGTVCWDHSMGDNTTPNGGGVEVAGCRDADPGVKAAAESEYAANIAEYNVAQNSWKPHWFIPGFDPTVEGWYDFELVAKFDDQVVSSTAMQIIVGNPELVCTPQSLPSWDGNIAYGTAEAEIEIVVPNGFKSIEIMPSSNNIVLLDVLGLSDLDRTGPLGSDFAPGHSMIEYTGGSAPSSVTARFGPQTQAGSRFMFRVTDQAGCEMQVDPQVDLTQDLPREITLHENYPNPFNPSTTISFDLPERADVHLSVYDAMGRRVSTLASGSFEAGTHDVSWNGTDAAGAPVASGIYFYRFEAGSLSKTKQMILLK